jgi:hypothetical protein
MAIIPFSLSERTILYCPSTEEIILSYRPEEINEQAEAFIARWSNEASTKPLIKDVTLQTAWEKFLEREFKKELFSDKIVNKFLNGIDDPEWVVYTTTFETSQYLLEEITVWYVVLADTVVEDRYSDSFLSR